MTDVACDCCGLTQFEVSNPICGLGELCDVCMLAALESTAVVNITHVLRHELSGAWPASVPSMSDG